MCIGLEVSGGTKYSFMLYTLKLITKNKMREIVTFHVDKMKTVRPRRLCNESIKMELADRRLKGM